MLVTDDTTPAPGPVAPPAVDLAFMMRAAALQESYERRRFEYYAALTEAGIKNIPVRRTPPAAITDGDDDE